MAANDAPPLPRATARKRGETMTNSITMNDLRATVNYLNELTGSPETEWTRDDDGQLHANVGNYHLSGAYGGWQLHRMYNTSGGVALPIGGGYVPKRELYERIRAYVAGILSTVNR